jgi:hypothetical protein
MLSFVLRKKTGEMNWNELELAHLKDQGGKTFFVVGIHHKVSMMPGTLFLHLSLTPFPLRRPSDPKRNSVQRSDRYP